MRTSPSTPVRAARPSNAHGTRPSTYEGGRRRALDPVQRILVALEGLVSLCGLGGGAYMTTHPTTIMPLRYLDGTWFHTWRWPGVALFVAVGVGPALAVVATLIRHRLEMVGHVAVGVGLVAWIVIEVTWIVVSPALQIAFGGVGVLVVVLAAREYSLRSRNRHG
jgi:hypothetical protein